MGRTRYACCGIISTPENVARWGYQLYSSKGKAISETVRNQLKNSTSSQRIPPWSSAGRAGGSPEEYGYLVTKKQFQSTEDTKPITTTYGHPGGGSGYSGWLNHSPELDLSISVIANFQVSSLGTCKVAKLGDCITAEIFRTYKDHKFDK
jgi:CubicO group peptidase (beta-lactamase class C family)